MDVVFAAYDTFERAVGNLSWWCFGLIDTGSHVCVDESGVDADDLGALAFELDSRGVGYDECCVLGRAVSGVEGYGKPTHNRQHVDDRSTAVLREDWGEGPRHRQGA